MTRTEAGVPDADGVVDWLTGAWSLDRTVVDSASGAALARMTGEVVFSPRSGMLCDYAERGLLSLHGGAGVEARRDYVFRQRRRGVSIFFDPACERLFHDLELTPAGDELTGSSIHHCGADIYRSLYSFAPDGSFEITHAVGGPRKAYVSRSRHIRALIR